jgi:hypothetical protein
MTPSSVLRSSSVLFAVLVACGGSSKPADAPSGSSGTEAKASEAEIAAAQKPCGDTDKVQQHDLSSDKATEAFAPCSKSGGGAKDYSALVKLETLDEGVHIIIDATDDDVTILGPDVKTRDAVIVYPKGKGQASIEVPLMKTKTGYHGDKIVLWDDLGKLNDEGTKLDVAIFDHDKSSGDTEEMHVAVGVSTGKSCAKAQDENPQTLNMNKKDSTKDLTKDELGRPISSNNPAASCGLPDSSHADICVLVRNGKPLGVTVNVMPMNNRIAACIDRRIRRLPFPVSDKADTVTYKY